MNVLQLRKAYPPAASQMGHLKLSAKHRKEYTAPQKLSDRSDHPTKQR
jgi:hypothetical protein